MFYDSEVEIKKALDRLENVQDRIQEVYDALSSAVCNSRHGTNVVNLNNLKFEHAAMSEAVNTDLKFVEQQIDEVLSAEQQFLEDD